MHRHRHAFFDSEMPVPVGCRLRRRLAGRLAWCVGWVAAALAVTPSAFVAAPIELALPVTAIRGQGAPVAPSLAIVVGLKDGKTIALPMVADTYVMRGQDKNNGDVSYFVLRDNGYAVCLVRPDLTPLAGVEPERIESAALHMKLRWREREGSASIRAHRMRTAWNESATWFKPRPGEDDEGSWNGTGSGVDFDAEPIARLEVPQVKVGPIVLEGLESVVKQWLKDDASAHGLILRFFGKSGQLNLESREEALRSQAEGNEAAEAAKLSPAEVLLGPEQAVSIELNRGLLERVLVEPDDLRSATLRFKVFQKTDSKTATVQVHRMIGSMPPPSASGFPHRPGETYEAEPLVEKSARDLTNKDNLKITLPQSELQRMLVSDGPLNLVLTLSDPQASPMSLATLAHEQADARPRLDVAITPREKHQVFDFPLAPTPGVYARAEGDRLMYGDRRLRLWGVATTALTHEAPRRLARLGFNAARVWGGGGPTGNQSVLYTDDADAAQGRLSETDRLDRYDRYIAACREHGIFVMCPMLMRPMGTDGLSRDDSFVAGGDDWEQWKAAVGKDPQTTVMVYAIFDERLQDAYRRHIAAFLNRVNPYTGRSYAEEEAIAIWELGNEHWIINKMLGGGPIDMPDYFQDKLLRQWNAWLKDRYGSTAGVLRAWGQLETGESLDDATVGLAPTLSQRNDYPKARGNDFVAFISGLISDFLLDLEAHARKQAPEGVGVNVAPFSFDTQYRPNTPWLYSTAAHADVANFGMYFWSMTPTLTAPPKMYVMDSKTVAGKPTVIYETNSARPSAYRVEHAMRNSVLASWQDWDAMFWHFYISRDWPDERFLTEPLLYMSEDFFWTAVEIDRDPAMLSAIALAGQVFLGEALRPAADPVRYVVGRDGAMGYELWNGVDTGHATFKRGAVIDFQPDHTSAVEAVNASADDNRPPNGPVRAGDEIIWDWPNGRLIIDSPTAKAYVGKTPPDGGWYRFSDGLAVGGFDTDFVAFGVVSADGKPLAGPDAAERMFVNARYDARNTGFDMDDSIAKPDGGFVNPVTQAQHIRDRGRSPIIETPVGFSLAFDRQLTGTWTGFDFAQREILKETMADAARLVHDGRPLFMGVLEVDRRGGLVKAPRTTLPIASAVAGGTGAFAAAEAGNADHPVRLDWSDSAERAFDRLEGGVIGYRSLSPRPGSTTTSLRVSGTKSVLDSLADVTVEFNNDRMRSVEADFTNPLPFAEVEARLTEQYGDPKTRDVSDNAFEVSRVTWQTREPVPLSVTLTETQGRMVLRYARGD